MFLSASDTVGKIVLTASGVVGDSGKSQILYGYAFKSSGTAGVLTLFDGTTSVAPSTVAWDQSGTINVTVLQNNAAGIVFTNGLFASFDANVSRATFWVRQFIT